MRVISFKLRAIMAALASSSLLFGAAAYSQQAQTKPSLEKSKAKAKAKAKGKAGDDANINAQFVNPDVKAFVARFESESREVFAKRDEIVKALGLKPGMAVADVGAGTGLFTRLFAEQVGKTGHVYAVDISQPFLTHIAAEAKTRGLTQISTVKATQESTGLDQDSVNLVFLCDVYHHVEKPSITLKSILNALRPDGELVVIDFDRVPGKSAEFVLKHVRAGKSVFFDEIKAAGFTPVPVKDAPALKDNFFARFRKAARPSD